MKTYDPIPLALHTRDFLAQIAASKHGTGRDWFRDLPNDWERNPAEYRKTVSAFWDWSTDPQAEAFDAYRAFAKELRQQWATLLIAGLNVEFTDNDPTHTTPDGKLDPEAFFRDYRSTEVLRIFRSKDGDHPITAPIHPELSFASIGKPTEHYVTGRQRYREAGVIHNGRRENLNTIFRAVHDFLGHMASGVGFGWAGETTAYYSHASTFSEEARTALFCETVAQQCYFYEHGRQFADVQKVIAYSPGFHRAPINFK